MSIRPEFISAFDQADAISFDAFDVVFTRPLRDPADLFDLVGARFNVSDFRKLRCEAEAEALQRAVVDGRNAPTLDGIYHALACIAPAAVLQQYEYELELALVRPNPEIAEVVQAAVATGKPVVLTADSHLPRRFFEEALSRFGFTGVTRLYISSDKAAMKRPSGALFEVMAADLNLRTERIVHVCGEADLAFADASGLQTVQYRHPVYAQLKGERSIAASLSTGLRRTDRAEEPSGGLYDLGYCSAGPAAMAFRRWVEKQATVDRVDLLLFVGDQGAVLHRLPTQAAKTSEVRIAHLESSRLMFLLAGVTETNFERTIDLVIARCSGMSPVEVFERIGVPTPADHVLADLGLGPRKVLTTSDLPLLARILNALKWSILAACQRNRRALFLQLHALGVRNGMRVGLVGLGWDGASQDALSQALAWLVDADLIGYYLCLAGGSHQLDGSKRAMLSGDTGDGRALVRQSVAIDRLLSSGGGEVVGYYISEEGDVVPLVHGRPQSSRGSETARGILDFATDFSALSMAARFTLNEADALRPLIQFANSPEALQVVQAASRDRRQAAIA